MIYQPLVAYLFPFRKDRVSFLLRVGAWENTVGGQTRKLYQFGGQVIAVRKHENNKATYLHDDHLGSVSVATKQDGTLASKQEYDPWERYAQAT